MAKQSNKRTNPLQPSHKTQHERTARNKKNAVIAHDRRVKARRERLANHLGITPEQLLGIRQFIRHHDGEERANLQRNLNNAIEDGRQGGWIAPGEPVNHSIRYLVNLVYPTKG